MSLSTAGQKYKSDNQPLKKKTLLRLCGVEPTGPLFKTKISDPGAGRCNKSMSLPTKAEFTPFTCCCYQGRQHAESKWPLSTEPARKFSLGVKNACRVEEQQHLICYSLTFSGGKVISQSFYLPTFLILYSKLTSTPVTDISKSLITNHLPAEWSHNNLQD